jgi:hypothetical protein
MELLSYYIFSCDGIRFLLAMTLAHMCYVNFNLEQYICLILSFCSVTEYIF